MSPRAVRTAAGVLLDDYDAMVRATAACFSSKWKVAAPSRLGRVPLSRDLAGRNFSGLATLVSPQAFAASIAELCSSTAFMSQMGVHDAVWGKRSSQPFLTELRALVPQSALLSVVDVVVSHRLHAWITQNLPVPPGTFVGGVPGSKVLEIAHGLSFFVERALDATARSRRSTLSNITARSIQS